jgi:hypothetical protein
MWPTKGMVVVLEVSKVFSAPYNLWDEILDSLMSKEMEDLQ